MTESAFLQAMRLAEKSRQERVQKVANLLSQLPEDFDWDELETLLGKQIFDNIT